MKFQPHEIPERILEAHNELHSYRNSSKVSKKQLNKIKRAKNNN